MTKRDDNLPSESDARALGATTRGWAMVRLHRAKVADYLTESLNPRQAAARAVAELGVSRSTANRYVASVLRQMCDDAQAEPLESKRARMVARLQAATRAALQHRRTYRTADGRSVTVDDPQFRAAATLMALEAQIEGLAKPGA